MRQRDLLCDGRLGRAISPVRKLLVLFPRPWFTDLMFSNADDWGNGQLGVLLEAGKISGRLDPEKE